MPLVLSPSETIDPLLQQFVVCFEFINFLLQLTDLVSGWGRRKERGVGGSDSEGGGVKGGCQGWMCQGLRQTLSVMDVE